MHSITREERKELRHLGWRPRRRKAKRPRRVPRRHFVPIEDHGEDDLVDLEASV